MAHLCLRLILWSDQSVRIHFFLLSCAQLSPRKRNLWTNQWVRWVGSWKLHAPFALKSLIRFAVVSHAAVGVGHENVLALLMQRSLSEYGKRFLTCNATELIRKTELITYVFWFGMSGYDNVKSWLAKKKNPAEDQRNPRLYWGSSRQQSEGRETAVTGGGVERDIKGNWTK